MTQILKQKIFYLIIIFSIFFILNLLSIILNSRVEKNILLNSESNQLIVKYYNKFNHLRDLNDKRFNYDENIENLILLKLINLKKIEK